MEFEMLESQLLTLHPPLLVLLLSLLHLLLSLLTNGFPLFIGGLLTSPWWTLVSLYLSLTFFIKPRK